MADTFIAPGRIVCGVNALYEAAGTIKALGEKALIVTDGMMQKLGNLAKVTAMLEEHGIQYAVEDGINGEPDDGMILHGLSVYREEKCDFLLALGGGSPIDSMKAIAMLAACGGVPADYMGKTVTQKLSPMVAVPTTAGTGSEATQFTIITDGATQVKMLLKGPALMPDLAVIDPMFTMTAPKGVTAATGVDALTHAIEAYTSRKAQPLADTFAVSACQRIFTNLKKVWENGQDRSGRIQMSLAALEAGIAFNNASVTIVHGMSRPIGALFHVPHGISNAMLLDVCLEYVMDGAVERFAELSRACGFIKDTGRNMNRDTDSNTDSDTDSDGEAARVLVLAVRQLLSDIGIPTLAEYGVDREKFFEAIPKMARDAAASGSPANTRKEITVEAMEELYKKLW